MSTWIKASEKMPEVGRNISMRNPNEEGEGWEYSKGIVKVTDRFRYYISIPVEYRPIPCVRYHDYFEKRTEWQYLEE